MPPDAEAPGPQPAPPATIDERSWALLRRFWRDWLGRRWPRLLISLALMAVVAGLTGLYGVVVKYAVNALGSGQMQYLWTVVAAIIAMTSGRSLFLYLQNIVTNRTIMGLTVDIQKEAYAHLLDADYARIARDTPGHLVSRLTNDVTAVQVAALALMNSTVRDALTVFATVICMIYIDWQLSLVVLGVYPLAFMPIMRIAKRLRRVAKRTQVELGGMTHQLTESLSATRLIKTFRLEDYAAARTNASFDQILKLRMKAVQSKASLDPLLEALGGLALAGVIAFVGYRIGSGVKTLGDFMGFISALGMAAQPIRGFGALPAKLQEGLAALQRMFELLDEKPAIIDRPAAQPLAVTRGEIVFDHVSFAYDQAVPAIRDFNLRIAGHCTVALVGHSGAGKTTVINLVPRLFEPQQGRILIDGQDIQTVTMASLREAISIVSQDVTLFADTVRANIALGRLGATQAEIEAAAEAAAASGFIADLDQGYDTLIGYRGDRLSGGQRQRLALARAILKDAPILLLDEATSALDTQSERQVQEALTRFSRGRTTIVIAHRLSTVQNADLICVMEAGTIIETGRHAELIDRGGAYARLCQAQVLLAAE